jgi:chemotaxis protein MotA
VDIATIIGILCGLACIALPVLTGASPAMFFHIPSLLIVGGGTVSSTLIHFSLKQVLRIVPVVRKTLFCKLPAPQELIQDMVNCSAIARRDGALALEQEIAKASDPFVVKSLQMIVDGQEADAIEEKLTAEIQCLQERHQEGRKLLEFMGAAAPAFGMIGTLMGLVSMLVSLSDPAGLGAGMAVALITTFYGAVAANLVFIPLAGKLGIRSKQEALTREMTREGVVGIARGESPSVVRERMQAFLSGKNREELKPTIAPAGQSRAA